MKIKTIRSYDKDYCRSHFSVEINDSLRVSFTDGEPEDANLHRDFRDCYKITDLLKAAYDAGRTGEGFELESSDVMWGEWW